MGAGNGHDHGCISITNHTSHPVDIVSIQDESVVDTDRKKTYCISPGDTHVFFTDRVENLSWSKPKE